MNPTTRRTIRHRLRSTLSTRALAVVTTLVLLSSALGVILPHVTSATPYQSNAVSGGTGATLPYVEMEAHSATTNGTIIGPDFTLGSLALDAVDSQDCQAMQLTRGQYVQFTLTQPENALNLRYSIPDSSSGGGINATLSSYINGVKQANDLQLTSKYSWLYGQPNFSNCNANDRSDTPGGTAHHHFDEVHMLLPQMAAGTTVKLQVGSDALADGSAADSNAYPGAGAPDEARRLSFDHRPALQRRSYGQDRRDNGLAMWSATDSVPATGDSNNTFDHDTIQSPYLANGIAIYGGNGNSVTNDQVTGLQYRGGGT